MRTDLLLADTLSSYSTHRALNFSHRIFHSWMFCLVPFQTGLFFSQHLALSLASHFFLTLLTAVS